MEREAWWAAVHEVATSETELSDRTYTQKMTKSVGIL